MKRSEYISDDLVVKRAKAAIKLELEKMKAMDVPIAVYDRKTNEIYMQNSDGSKLLVGERLRKGRYSEQNRKKTEIVVFAGPNGSEKAL